jgi:protein ImuB
MFIVGQKSLFPGLQSGSSCLQSRKEVGEWPPARHVRHLWLCLYFDCLPLEVFCNEERRPRAVIDEHKRGAQVLVCNELAGKRGVRPGLSVNAALALVPDLSLKARNRQRERAALLTLADWAINFTPAVSIDSFNALLLDIQGSLRFFGGLGPLRALITQGVRARGHRFVVACAPTPRAALWLARAGQAMTVRQCAELPGRLAALPLDCLGWPEDTCRALGQMGVRTLGECARLPRNGLARRIGTERLRELDQGYGRQPEAMQFHRPAKNFQGDLELPEETADSERIVGSLRVLLERLRHFLITHQGGTEVLWISLMHDRCPATVLRIGLLKSSMDTTYLMELIGIRFAGICLVAPVTAVSVQTCLVSISMEPARDLFGRTADSDQKIKVLLERLRARLGNPAVHGVRLFAEYRPEFAWRPVQEVVDFSGNYAARLPETCRPLWVLPKPIELDVVQNQPRYQGMLSLGSGPERIESGWWDGGDIRRDYYMARHHCGRRLWVFKDQRNARWYLHGLFG